MLWNNLDVFFLTSLVKLLTLKTFLPTGFSRRIVVELEAPYLAFSPKSSTFTNLKKKI